MKTQLYFLLLFTSTILLYGCPYESPYGIDEEPQQYINESLLGKWATIVPRPSDDKHYKEEPVKIIFAKKTEMEYDIAITGYLEELRPYRVITNDSIKGTAYISLVDGKQLLNVFINGKMYIAEVIKENKFISILALHEHFTSKYIKSSEALRSAVSIYYKSRANPAYDDWFVLKGLQKVN